MHGRPILDQLLQRVRGRGVGKQFANLKLHDEESIAAYNEILEYVKKMLDGEDILDWLTEGRLEDLCVILSWPYGTVQRAIKKAMEVSE